MNYEQSAVISEDGFYRYLLRRSWGERADKQNWLLWVMLNPSTADGVGDDATIRKIRKFAQREGYNGFLVVNLYAFRATDPKMLPPLGGRDGFNATGESNNAWIVNAARSTQSCVCAWGSNKRITKERVVTVMTLLHRYHKKTYCLGTNNDGNPKHPLYRPDNNPLEIYSRA